MPTTNFNVVYIQLNTFQSYLIKIYGKKMERIAISCAHKSQHHFSPL